MDVLYASSLPRPRLDIHGICPRLVSLILKSRVEDCEPASELDNLVRPLEAPALQRLHLGGLAFREAYRHASLFPTSITHLTISHYGAHNPSYPLTELVESIRGERITKTKMTLELHLIDVHLDCSYAGPPLMPHPRFEVDSMTFENMQGHVLAEFHRFLDFPSYRYLAYKRCSLPISVDLAFSQKLHLLDIDDSRDLFHLLGDWDASECKHLVIENCQGLNDDVLDKLAKEDVGGRWLCPYLSHLEIENCFNYLTQGLWR